MPAPTVASSSSYSNATTSTFAVPCPTGTQSGDILLAFEESHAGGAALPPSVPSGFSVVDSITFTSNYFLQAFWQKVTTPLANYTFNNASGSGPVATVWLLRISGGAGTGPEGDVKNSGSGLNASTGSYTTQQANELIACAFACDVQGATFHPDANLTDLGTITGSGGSIDVGWRDLATAMATSDTASITGTSVADWGAMLIAIPPGSGGGSSAGPLRPIIWREVEPHPCYRE